jgi:hypothetical protein
LGLSCLNATLLNGATASCILLFNIWIPNLNNSNIEYLPFSSNLSMQGGDGGVIKQIIKAGSGYESPEKGDKVNGTLSIELYYSNYRNEAIVAR